MGVETKTKGRDGLGWRQRWGEAQGNVEKNGNETQRAMQRYCCGDKGKGGLKLVFLYWVYGTFVEEL